MFLEPQINDQEFSRDIQNLNWAKTIEILRKSFLEIHPSVLEEAKKHFPNGISTVEEKLILNGGRGILQSKETKKIFQYAKLVDKQTIFILTTFNQSHKWAALAKKILNLPSKDININFGTDPKCESAVYSRSPKPGHRVYITDVNGLNRMISSDFFNGNLFGNKIDLMVIDRFFQTLLMISDSVLKEIFPVVFVDEVLMSSNYESMRIMELISWTDEQKLTLKDIAKLPLQSTDKLKANYKIIEILEEVDFILGRGNL